MGTFAGSRIGWVERTTIYYELHRARYHATFVFPATLRVPTSMSYDLMVFDPQSPPSGREGFMSWYQEQTQWAEDHDYNNPDVCTPALRAWFFEMIKEFPAMNGPHASEEVDNPKLTDYCIGRSVIYAAFAWPEAVAASKAVTSLAEKHQVGLFDVSATNGGVWLPAAKGDYVCVHGEGARRGKRKWWQLWK